MSNFIEFLKIVVFGVVEGFTEWLPISSTMTMRRAFWIRPIKKENMRSWAGMEKRQRPARRLVMNSREKFLHDIGRFELHACGVDTRMAAEILVL